MQQLVYATGLALLKRPSLLNAGIPNNRPIKLNFKRISLLFANLRAYFIANNSRLFAV